MENAWLPPEERSFKELERNVKRYQQQSATRPSPFHELSRASADASRSKDKRGSVAATPLPTGVKGARSPERTSERLLEPPRGARRRGNSRGRKRSGSRDGRKSQGQSREPSPNTDGSRVSPSRGRKLTSMNSELFEDLVEDDQDSEVGLPEQIIPELSALETLEPIIRQPSAMKALQTELSVLHRELEDANCKVQLLDEDIFNWEVELAGPESSPYYGGIFRFLLHFPPDYPTHMPRIRCATPIFHCNIDQNGNVCLGTFDENGLSPTALVPRVDDGSYGNFCRTQLRLMIINARGLRNADFGGASDPYLTGQIPGKDWSRFQTAVINDTMNPVWNEEHVINDYIAGDHINFEIWDDDDAPFGEADDELLGKATLDSSWFYPDGFEGELTLTDTGKAHRSTLKVKASVIMPRRVHDRTTALDIVEGLISLLTLPIVQNPLVPAAARLFQEDRRQYNRIAREWTLQYAL